MSEPLQTFKVVTYHPKTGRRIHIKVRALYYKIEDGSLVFRVPVQGSYPVAVHRFARGSWAEVLCDFPEPERG